MAIHKILSPNRTPELNYFVDSHIYDDYFTITIYDTYGMNFWYKYTIACFSRSGAIRCAEKKIKQILNDYLKD